MENLLDLNSNFWLIEKFYSNNLQALCAGIQFRKNDTMIIIDESNSKAFSYLFIRATELSKMIVLLNEYYVKISRKQFLFDNENARNSFNDLIKKLNTNNEELNKLFTLAGNNIQNSDMRVFQRCITDSNQMYVNLGRSFKESCRDENKDSILLKQITAYVTALKSIEDKCHSFKSSANSFFN